MVYALCAVRDAPAENSTTPTGAETNALTNRFTHSHPLEVLLQDDTGEGEGDGEGTTDTSSGAVADVLYIPSPNHSLPSPPAAPRPWEGMEGKGNEYFSASSGASSHRVCACVLVCVRALNDFATTAQSVRDAAPEALNKSIELIEVREMKTNEIGLIVGLMV